ncbi:cytochrome P450 [Streptomyces syringium]|uniref:cytochrome P450 n=1 Tax=Streptomyces syringium TaxID=76729 RepID=UPI0037D88B56
MTELASVSFPAVRERVLGPSECPRGSRGEAPITRLTFEDGRPGWLVTGHSTARAVLADPRFTAKGERHHPPVPRAPTLGESPAAPTGMFNRQENAREKPEEQHYRKLLHGQLGDERMHRLTEWIEKSTEELLDAMERHGAPADLLEHFALPLPSLVICELLGVPDADREEFQRASAVWSGLGETTEAVLGAFTSLHAYLHRLVPRRRAHPGGDLLSGLIAADDALTDDELASIAFLLLAAGHETVAHQLALGVLTLLENPGQLAALRADPSLLDGAVEELLRHLSVVHHGPTRAALEDVEIDGRLVRAGEIVMVSLAAANHDPERFAAPATLDLTRDATGHLAFGHGAHRCLGRRLARIELRVALGALLRRFPRLRAAVPPRQIPLRHDAPVRGVRRAPVTW